MRTSILILMLLTSACQWLPGGADAIADDGLRAHVKKAFAAGKQCSSERYEIPVAEDILRRAGVRTFGGYEEPMAVCQACEVCPAYAAEQFVLIARADTAKAKSLGFSVVYPMPD